jgi:dUTPase
MPSIPLKRLAAGAPLPTRATDGSFGYDLATAQDEVVGARETRVLPCGFKLAADLPHDRSGGLAMLILPRSSLGLGLLGGMLGLAAASTPTVPIHL